MQVYNGIEAIGRALNDKSLYALYFDEKGVPHWHRPTLVKKIQQFVYVVFQYFLHYVTFKKRQLPLNWSIATNVRKYLLSVRSFKEEEKGLKRANELQVSIYFERRKYLGWNDCVQKDWLAKAFSNNRKTIEELFPQGFLGRFIRGSFIHGDIQQHHFPYDYDLLRYIHHVDRCEDLGRNQFLMKRNEYERVLRFNL